MEEYDVIVIGAGLAGLTAAYYLSKAKKKVLLVEKKKFLGGRTSSWDDQGMIIESGFHRHIGYYKELPRLLKEVGVNLNSIIEWEKELEIKVSNQSIILGIDPFHAPIKFVKGMIGNHKLLPLKDKISLSKLFLVGFKDYALKPKTLDYNSILEYAKKKEITKNVIENIVTPFSTGIFFQPKENYSAKLFFGIFYPSLFRMINIRIGAYKMGMSEALANPIANKIKENKGTVLTNTKVNSLLFDRKKVTGVKLSNGSIIYSQNTILATDIGNAKQIIQSLPKNSFFQSLLKIPTTSALTVQLELKNPIQSFDRVTFSPNTILTSFTEESHTTFQNSNGRVSIILENPDYYIKKSDHELLDLILKDFRKINIDLEKDLIDFRVVRHNQKFYDLGPNHDQDRPSQKTPINGLLLAGDYTRQKFYATMEGAVLSGIAASNILLKQKD